MASRIVAEENLERFQCMFTWARGVTDDVDSCWVIKSMEDKLLTPDCEWQSIIYHLVLFYEYQLQQKDSAARDHLVDCEDIILDSECFAAAPLVKRYSESIKHVLYSSWIHFIAKTVGFEDFKDYLTQIKLYKKMNKKEKAGVLGIHAACLMQYGVKGNKAAMEFVRLAIKFDEHEGHWHYLLGEILRYNRLLNPDPDLQPTPEEIKSLELAHFYDEHTPSHYLALAGSLYDSVKKEKGPSEVRDKATQLYKTALENWPNSPFVNLMCASGLLCYAYPVRDTKLCDKCLGKALRLAPCSSHVNLVAGIFFKWPNNNAVAANRYFNLAKKRFTSIVDNINQGVISTYRTALLQAVAEPAPAPVVVVARAEPESPSDSEDDNDYLISTINAIYAF